MTEKLEKFLNYAENAKAGMDYFGQEAEYREFAESDRQALRQYVKASLTKVSGAFYQQTNVQADKAAATADARRRMADELAESSLEITAADSAEIATAVLSEDPDALTDEILDKIIDSPNALRTACTTAADLMADEEKIDNALETVGDASLSYAADQYAKTGQSVYDVIQNLKTPEVLADMKEELELGDYIKNTNDLFKAQYAEKQRAYDYASKIAKGVDRDAKELEKMLGGLTPADGDAYQERLSDIVAYVSKTPAGESVFTYAGVSADKISTVGGASRYVSELIGRSEHLSGRKEEMLLDVDFASVTDRAREKAASTSAAELKGQMNDLHKNAARVETDGATIAHYFDGCETAEQVEAAYAKALSDMTGNKMELEGIENPRFSHSRADIVRANDYLLRAARMNGVATDLISGDRIKKTCDRLLNASVNAHDMLCDFNEALNRFSVEGAELVQLAVRKETDSPDYQIALAKTEGLKRDADPELLKDAVGIYARLKEIHDHRTFWQKLRHPFRNRDENNALARMKTTLTRDLGMSEEALEQATEEALNTVNEPIGNAARKNENPVNAYNVQKAAEERAERRLGIIRSKITDIKEKERAAHVPGAAKKDAPAVPEKKPEQPEKVDINRLRDLSEPDFKKVMDRRLNEERAELEKNARGKNNGEISPAKKAEIDGKVEELKSELIQLHVDPQGYFNDLKSRENDEKKSSMEKAVIEAIADKSIRDRLKKEHREHEEMRERNGQEYREREELRREYFEAATVSDRYGLDAVGNSAEQKSLDRMREEMKFIEKLGKDVNAKNEKDPIVNEVGEAQKQLVAEGNSLEK